VSSRRPQSAAITPGLIRSRHTCRSDRRRHIHRRDALRSIRHPGMLHTCRFRCTFDKVLSHLVPLHVLTEAVSNSS